MRFTKFYPKAIKVHGTKYDYSKYEDLPYGEKVCMICHELDDEGNEHGEFWQEPSKHLIGRGCPKCAHPNYGLTNERFIKKARKVHGDKYDYNKVVYVDTHTKVCIICPIHGEFWQTPKEHLRGQGCPKCRYNTISKKRRSNKDEFVKKARKIHGDKYDYSKVEYVNSKTPICIICPIHGEFWMTPGEHLRGNGCSKCSGKFHYDTEEFIRRARLVHGDKYDYSKTVYVNSSTPVCIICPIHGEFWQMPNVHLKGGICLKCSYEERTLKRSGNKEWFEKKAREVHGDKYNYSKVEYINNHTPVCIICPEHGEFWQTPQSHLQGSGCPNCSPNRNWKYTTEEWIEAAKLVHGDKYDYSKVVYINCHTPVCIICPEHGEFWQDPSRHLSGAGCPSCNNSKLENEVFEYLHDNGINFKREFNEKGFGRLRCDFFLPDHKLVIECQGEQHFTETKFANEDEKEVAECFVRQINNDLKKKNIVEEKGYTIIYYTLHKNMKKKPLKNPLFKGIYTKDNLFCGKTALAEYLINVTGNVS